MYLLRPIINSMQSEKHCNLLKTSTIKILYLFDSKIAKLYYSILKANYLLPFRMINALCIYD